MRDFVSRRSAGFNSESLGPWAAEARALVSLGAPLVLTQLAQMAMITTDVIMVGALGQTALAAAALSSVIYMAAWLIGNGPAAAVSPVIAQILGARPKNRAGVRTGVRMGLWAAALVAPLIWAVLAYTRTWLLMLEQAPQLAAAAGPYVQALGFGLPFAFGFAVLRNFVTALSRPRAPMIIVMLMVGTNVLGNYVLIFGHFGLPALGLLGSGISSALTNAFGFFALLSVALASPAFRPYRILRRFFRPDWGKLAQIFRLGISIGLATVFEVMLFSISTLMMGRFGEASLAAHQIAMNVPSITFMVPLGIGMAGSVRVALSAGRGDPDGVRRAGLTAIVLGAGFMALCGIVLAAFPRQIASLYLPDTPANAGAFALTVIYLRVAAGFQLFDGIQVIAIYALRGLKDAHVPMWLAAGSYWLVGFPLAALLGFDTALQGLGIWIGLAVSLAFAAAAMFLRFAYLSGLIRPARPLARGAAA